jgi:beta-lactamase regulating signal transducer with metallopeptidase domain
MSAIEHLFTQPAAQAVGWALLQFVWQGAVIGIITAAALAALRRSAPDVRYVVGTIGLSLMFTMPVVTGVQTWRASDSADTHAGSASSPSDVTANAVTLNAPEAASPAVALPAGAGSDAPSDAARSGVTFKDWNSLLSLMLLVWLCGVGILTLRLMSGWMWIRRMKTRGTSPTAAIVHEIAERIARNLHIRRTVTYLQSTLVDVPTVVGWLKPVVLIPASALAALAPEQLEAIIAHELAHIRRHDYLVNLLQTLVETLLFYHPAVWWLSRRIRIERENCCDDLAVNLCGDALTYARALADLEELRGPGQRGSNGTNFVLAADGASLLQRVRRLLGAPTHAGRAPGWLAGSAAVLLITGIAAGAIGNAALTSAQAPAVPAVPVAPSTVIVPPAKAAVPVAPAHPTTAVPIAAGEIRVTPAIAASPGTREVPAVPIVPAVAAVPAAAAMPEFSAVPVPKAVPAPPSAPAVPVVEPARPQSTSSSSSEHSSSSRQKSGDDEKGNYIWSNNGHKIEIEYKGRFEFTDDDTDVKSISPGGYLKISEGRSLSKTTVELNADNQGNITRRYWSGTSERPYEPEGRQWLAQTLPRFIRQSGIGASARVARIYKAKGLDGVLAEIQLIEGSWARRVYYSELLKTGTLEPKSIAQVLQRAGKDLDSDFELASLLTGFGDKLLVDDVTRRAYFDAARSIESDFEMRRVFSSALKRGPLSPEILAGLLEGSTAIDSDFELASLLVEIAKLQPLDSRSRPGFFKAAATVESDFEHRRVLDNLASRTDLDETTLKDLLESSIQIDSDFEEAALLMTVLKRYSAEGALRQPFFRAVDSIGSSFERSRVLNAVAKRTDTSPETVMAILRSTKSVDSSFESSRVLQTLAAAQPIKGEARDLYIAIAEGLGDFEQGRVLSALMKNERSAAK